MLSDYLDDISLPLLTVKRRDELDAPLTKEEIELAIAQMPSHKTPGGTINLTPVEPPSFAYL